jgi:hypothetical protein
MYGLTKPGRPSRPLSASLEQMSASLDPVQDRAQHQAAMYKGPPKKKKGTKKQFTQKITDRLPFFFLFLRTFFYLFKQRTFFFCGHATACGHPQLAAGSSFTS